MTEKDLAALVQRFKHFPSVEDRLATGRALLELGRPGVDALLAFAGSFDYAVRHPAAQTLRGEIVFLSEFLKESNDWSKRRAAAEVLSESGPSGIGALLAILTDESNEGIVRLEAADALRGALDQLDDPRALTYFLTHREASTRLRAAQALSNRGWKPRDKSEQIAFHVAAKEWKELTALGKPAANAMLNVYEASDAPTITSKDQNAIEAAVREIGDSESLVRLQQAKRKKKLVNAVLATVTLALFVGSIAWLATHFADIPADAVWGLALAIVALGGVGFLFRPSKRL